MLNAAPVIAYIVALCAAAVALPLLFLKLRWHPKAVLGLYWAVALFPMLFFFGLPGRLHVLSLTYVTIVTWKRYRPHARLPDLS